MIFLSKDIICDINRLTVKYHGGNYTEPRNFLHEKNLDYLLEIIHSKAFGEELYPKLSDKAGLYMFSIVSNHVFHDGNKRTGLEAAVLFYRANGYNINASLSTKELVNFTISLASGELTLEEVQQWFEKNIVPEYL